MTFFMNNRNKFNKGPVVSRHKPVLPKKIEKSKASSKSAELFQKYKDDLGTDYSLNDIIEIGYPIIETQIEIIASGKPSDVLQELHIFLLDLVSTGIDSKPALSDFLGLHESDFVLDELYILLENGLLINENGTYRVSTKGQLFVEEKKFIPVTTHENFTFYTDAFTQVISNTSQFAVTNSENRLNIDLKINFEFIQKNWIPINKCYSQFTGGEKEIVDLASYKRSISFSTVKFKRIYALLYYPVDQSGKKIQIKAYNGEGYLKNETSVLNGLFASDKFLFDFSKELAATEEFKSSFEDEIKIIENQKKLSGEYKDISTFEHRELIEEALLTAELAVYIESPWIRKATREYVEAMRFFLQKKNTKLFIAHGIDADPRNFPKKDVFDELDKLRSQYPERFFIWHLPTHFQSAFPGRDGSHRKILIKDFDFYVKGSFNWLSYSGKEGENYAVEEGTQFFDNVDGFWKRVFDDYKLDSNLLTFIINAKV